MGSSRLRGVCDLQINMDKSIKEIEHEITVLEGQIEQIRIENSFREETSGIEHSTPKSTLRVSNSVDEHDSGLASGRPSEYADFSRTEACMYGREEYSGVRPNVRFSTEKVEEKEKDKNLEAGVRNSRLMSRTIDEPTLPNFEENENSHALRRGEDGITMRRNRSHETKRASEKIETKFNPTDKAPMSTFIKPATFDGSGSWLDYISHFEAC